MIYVAQWIKSKIQTSQKIDRLVHVHKCIVTMGVSSKLCYKISLGIHKNITMKN